MFGNMDVRAITNETYYRTLMENLKNKTLSELKSHFQELAGRWNGDEPKGEDQALMATDIVDTIISLEGQIDNFNF